MKKAYLCHDDDFDHEVVDVYLAMPEDNDKVNYIFLKGFDDIEWKELGVYTKDVASLLNIEYIGYEDTGLYLCEDYTELKE